MKTRKTPMRKCTGCQTSKDKRELIRVVRSQDGTVSVDRTGKKSGRGAYICDDVKCLERAIRTKALERSLEVTFGEEIYAELRAQLEEKDL